MSLQISLQRAYVVYGSILLFYESALGSKELEND